VATALYRRYRPESFAEMIGQSQVTDPLMAALRSNRVNHAYLFSGPRGCGKTTSARILARCLNCAEGPTDTPCGVCPSCIELARGGGGSMDVVEIDAASHNGVDDARELRERASFAPARDRYKIFILDEAHMVTPQGFNALLKLVEEPPEHVKFIFATTEPEKVIGTIRSRTHHYPFRLIPQALMLDYVEKMCESENVKVEAGVLQLVVRAGGGSARDTLSVLDQLIAGTDGDTVTYERAVSLLGYTHTALLDEAVDALAARDSAAAFAAADRVIQTGQDPRRFVEDLLERLRDLIIVSATGPAAANVLRGVPHDELERMNAQARAMTSSQLSHAADVVNSALTEMSGATSPRLHLELMIARLLVESNAPGVAPSALPIAAPAPAPAPQNKPAVSAALAPAPAIPTAMPTPEPTPPAEQVAEETRPPVTAGVMKQRWSDVLADIETSKRAAWLVVSTAEVRDYADEVLTLVFARETDAAAFRPQPGVPGGVHEITRQSIQKVLGVNVKFRLSVEGTRTQPVDAPLPDTEVIPVSAPQSVSSVTPELEPATDVAAEPEGWSTVQIPGSKPKPAFADADADADGGPNAGPDATKIPEPIAGTPLTADTATITEPSVDAEPDTRYGESLVREVLGATFISEEKAPSPASESESVSESGLEEPPTNDDTPPDTDAPLEA
jgi:DNA polymerase-3 subunit gamma/tau